MWLLNVTGQHDRRIENLTRQTPNPAGHCPVTGRYFQPCFTNEHSECLKYCFWHEKIKPYLQEDIDKIKYKFRTEITEIYVTDKLTFIKENKPLRSRM